MTRAILCRYGELFLKGGNRGQFEKRLADNVRRILDGAGKVERLHGRMLVWPEAGPGNDNGARVLERLQRVFGLTSLSPVAVVARELPAIAEAAVAEARVAADDLGGKPTFKVVARRADKRFQPASPEIAKQIGAAIVEAVGLPVDVHRPAITVGVEVGFEHAFAYARVVPGPGGLPVGSSGKADLLLSGGIDSPVAGWTAMKRGLHLAATYFHSFPYTGDRTKEKVLRIARTVGAWQSGMQLRVVPFTATQKALAALGEPRLNVVLYRRMMLRVAERLAARRGALALVTGDALGQVASQTLENLSVIGAATKLLVLRPLIGDDKLETIAVAQRIGTYDTSIEPYEDCCSLFVPDHPETRARLEKVLELEAKLDVGALVEQCVSGVETLD